MATATTLRILRQKYDIRLRELAERGRSMSLRARSCS